MSKCPRCLSTLITSTSPDGSVWQTCPSIHGYDSGYSRMIKGPDKPRARPHESLRSVFSDYYNPETRRYEIPEGALEASHGQD